MKNSVTIVARNVPDIKPHKRSQQRQQAIKRFNVLCCNRQEFAIISSAQAFEQFAYNQAIRLQPGNSPTTVSEVSCHG